jgi:hypothetical protein
MMIGPVSHGRLKLGEGTPGPGAVRQDKRRQWGARLLLFFVFFLRNDARERLILKEGTR